MGSKTLTQLWRNTKELAKTKPLFFLGLFSWFLATYVLVKVTRADSMPFDERSYILILCLILYFWGNICVNIRGK